MDFLHDPFTQFLISNSIALISAILTALSLYFALPTRQTKQHQQEPRLPSTAPLPKTRSLAVKLASLTCFILAIYCFVEIIASLYPNYPYPRWIAFVFALACIFFLFLLTPYGRRTIEQLPQRNILADEEEQKNIPRQHQ